LVLVLAIASQLGRIDPMRRTTAEKIPEVPAAAFLFQLIFAGRSSLARLK